MKSTAPAEGSNAHILFDQLEHVRLIHFSILLVSGIVLYLVLESWTDAPELSGQLKTLQKIISEPRELARILPPILESNAEPIEERIAAELAKTFRANIHVDAGILGDPKNPLLSRELGSKFVHVINFPSKVDSMRMRIADVESALAASPVPVEIVEDIKPLNDGVVLEGSSSVFTIVTSDPLLTDFVPQAWPNGGDQGSARIEFTNITTATDIEHGMSTTSEKITSVEVTFTTTRVDPRLSSDWIRRIFPAIESNWNEVRGLSIQGAQRWTIAHHADKVRSGTSSFIGFEIKNEYVGIVGPALIFCLLIYCITYVLHLLKFPCIVKSTEGTAVGVVSPWIGAMSGVVPIIVNCSTLVLIPGLATFLSIARLQVASWPVAMIATGFIGVAGIFVFIRGLSLCSYRLRDARGVQEFNC
ncbi:MAG: hypothetical protein HY286_12290 [Planctomycetes bacterium]|nr:hypothetical protein [Planctomycetota bacterium]